MATLMFKILEFKFKRKLVSIAFLIQKLGILFYLNFFFPNRQANKMN